MAEAPQLKSRIGAILRSWLNQPLWVQYVKWLGLVASGDFGRSFRTGQTVLQAVTERLPVSIELMLLAEIVGLAIGVPLAIACAVRAGSDFDRFMTGTAFGMLSVPAFLSVNANVPPLRVSPENKTPLVTAAVPTAARTPS